MSAHEVWTREVVSEHDPAFEVALQIYEASFPPSEKISAQVFANALNRRATGHEPFSANARMLTALKVNEPVGFAYFRYFYCHVKEQPFHLGYLLYMAVAESQRGGGIGQHIYHSVLAALKADAAYRGGALSGLIFEVERPELAEDSESQRNTMRRMQFYERLGARVLQGIAYVQPALGEELLPVPMHLMYHPQNEDVEDKTLCALFYNCVFGFDEDHPLVLGAVNS